jgi:hypothetical protein
MNDRRQFSLLGLLGLTTIVALYLTFAHHFPRFAATFFVVGSIWAALLLFAERLLLVARSRWWVLFTAVISALFGSAFLLLSVSFFASGEPLTELVTSAAGTFGALFAIGGLVCIHRARKGYQRFRATGATEKAASNFPNPSKQRR